MTVAVLWSFLVGVALAYSPSLGAGLVVVLLAAGTVALVVSVPRRARRRWLRQMVRRLAPAVVLCFVLGAAYAQWRYTALPEALPVLLEKQDFLLKGQVVSLPVHNGRAWRFEFLPSLSHDKDGTPYALQKLDLRWYVSHQQTLALGEVYTFEARLNNFHNLGLPGAFDYRAFQLGRGIQARGYVREAVAYHGIQRNPLQRLRAGLFQRLKRVPDLQHADLIAALMLGVKEGMKRESERLLRVFGLVHLLAISGLHVALVFGFVFVFLKALLRGLALARAPMPPSWLPLIVALAVVWVYALVSGWDIPVTSA